MKSSDALDNGLRGKDINESSLGQVPSANQLGNQGPGAYEQRWALVASDGTIKEQSGGITVTKEANPGLYVVNFGSSLVNQGLDVSPVSGTATARVIRCGGGNGATCGTGGNTTSEALVNIRNIPDGALEDGQFYISVNP